MKRVLFVSLVFGFCAFSFAQEKTGPSCDLSGYAERASFAKTQLDVKYKDLIGQYKVLVSSPVFEPARYRDFVTKATTYTESETPAFTEMLAGLRTEWQALCPGNPNIPAMTAGSEKMEERYDARVKRVMEWKAEADRLALSAKPEAAKPAEKPGLLQDLTGAAAKLGELLKNSENTEASRALDSLFDRKNNIKWQPDAAAKPQVSVPVPQYTISGRNSVPGKLTATAAAVPAPASPFSFKLSDAFFAAAKTGIDGALVAFPLYNQYASAPRQRLDQLNKVGESQRAYQEASLKRQEAAYAALSEQDKAGDNGKTLNANINLLNALGAEYKTITEIKDPVARHLSLAAWQEKAHEYRYNGPERAELIRLMNAKQAVINRYAFILSTPDGEATLEKAPDYIAAKQAIADFNKNNNAYLSAAAATWDYQEYNQNNLHNFKDGTVMLASELNLNDYKKLGPGAAVTIRTYNQNTSWPQRGVEYSDNAGLKHFRSFNNTLTVDEVRKDDRVFYVEKSYTKSGEPQIIRRDILGNTVSSAVSDVMPKQDGAAGYTVFPQTEVKLPAGAVVKKEKDLSSQFYMPPVQSQGDRGLCHAYATTGLLSAGLMRATSQQVLFSPADMSGAVMRDGNYFQSYTETSEPGVDEGYYVFGDLRHAMQNGLATASYDTQAFKNYDAAKQDALAVMGALNDMNKEKFWRQALTFGDTLDYIDRLGYFGGTRASQAYADAVMKDDADLLKERAISKQVFSKSSMKMLIASPKSPIDKAALVRELDAGRPVSVAMNLAGLEKWGSPPGPYAGHAFLVTGYKELADGKVIFTTRNSWGGDNPIIEEDELDKIMSADILLMPGEK